MEAEIVPLPAPRDWTTRIGLKFYRYKNLIKHRWWLLLLTVGLGLAWQGWVLFSQPTTYESVGLLIVSGGVKVTGGAQYREQEEGFYGTQVQLLENAEIQENARRRVAIESPALPPCKVKVTPALAPRTNILTVSGRGVSAEYTQHFVNAVMEEFLNFKRAQAGSAVSGVASQFTGELTRLGKERDQREIELQAFIKQNNMAFWEEQGRTSSKYLSDLKTKQANLVTEMQRLQNLSSDQLLSRPNDAGNNDGSVGSEFNQQFALKSQELIQKKAELAERSKVWRTEHPKLKEMQEDIASLERLLTTIKSQTRENAQMRIGAIKAEMESLDSSITVWNQKVMEASTKDAEYQHLKESLAHTNDVYEKLVGNIRELDLGNIDQGNVQIMQKAGLPSQVNPGTVKHLFIGLFFGLLVGGVALVIMDRADDRFNSSTEVIEQFNESILGQIPDVENSRTDAGLPLLQEDDERYVFAEAFRSLRSSLLFLPGPTALKSVLVTSSIPGEGKSTIASNLAVTMAVAGTRVLLVDADLRRGDVASLFDIDGRFGLSSIVRDDMPWRSVARSSPYPTLTIIPRGPVTNQSSELLLDPKVLQLLTEWKSLFDLVIFNSSPILATDDTASIAPNFDGALMVIRAKFTSARLVRNSMNALYQRQVRVLGLVLNCIDTEMPDYYYYRYPKYYAA